MSREPRPHVEPVASIPHGGLDYRELARRELAPSDVIDFSANVNPFGPSPCAREALRRTAIDRYPDRRCVVLRQTLAEVLRTSPKHLLVGNGASELIWLIALAFLRPGDSVLIPQPTYGEYERVARMMGARIVVGLATEEGRFRIPENAVMRVLEQESPQLCFLCRPNNPTGTLLPVSVVETWAQRFDKTLFVIDEAYLDFLPDAPTAMSCKTQNILVVRSLGKAHALPGLRVGYAKGDPNLLSILSHIRPPWSVSAPAQAAAVAAIGDKHHLRQSLKKLAAAKRELIADLTSAGFRPVPSETPFFLIKVGAASAVRTALLDHGVLVRDCTSFGLPQFIRIIPRGLEENAVLLDALKNVRPDRVAQDQW